MELPSASIAVLPVQSPDTMVTDYDCSNKYFVSVVGANRTRINIHESSGESSHSPARLLRTLEGHTHPITCLQASAWIVALDVALAAPVVHAPVDAFFFQLLARCLTGPVFGTVPADRYARVLCVV